MSIGVKGWRFISFKGLEMNEIMDNGIVSVNAYGVYSNITFPLIVKIFKPKGTLKESDKYKTKIKTRGIEDILSQCAKGRKPFLQVIIDLI